VGIFGNTLLSHLPRTAVFTCIAQRDVVRRKYRTATPHTTDSASGNDQTTATSWKFLFTTRQCRGTVTSVSQVHGKYRVAQKIRATDHRQTGAAAGFQKFHQRELSSKIPPHVKRVATLPCETVGAVPTRDCLQRRPGFFLRRPIAYIKCTEISFAATCS